VPSPKERKKKKPQRDKRETLRERIATAIVGTFFSHILGEMDELVPVGLRKDCGF
jgi:hypothetical protein